MPSIWIPWKKHLARRPSTVCGTDAGAWLVPLGGDYQLPREVWWVSCLLGTPSTFCEPKTSVLQLFNHKSPLDLFVSSFSHCSTVHSACAYSSPFEWHVLLFFPPGQANLSASVNILTLFLPYNLERAVRTMETAQTSLHGHCYEQCSVTQV